MDLVHDVPVAQTRTKKAALFKKKICCVWSLSSELNMFIEDNDLKFQVQIYTKAFAKCSESLGSEFLVTSAELTFSTEQPRFCPPSEEAPCQVRESRHLTANMLRGTSPRWF